MEITFKGEAKTLEGTLPTVGEQVPAFAIKNTSGEEVGSETLKGKVAILSVFPDITTRVCDKQTRRFHEVASEIEGVQLVSVSKNTEEELSQWCAANGIQMEMLHDDTSEFGKAFGVYIPEMDKLARSVFVLNQEGQLAYKEVVPEGSEEPNYEAAVEAAKDWV